MTGYDYMADLNRLARQEKKRLSRIDKLESKQAWNRNACGSAECASGRWDSILDAYNEYKTNKDW